MLLCAHGLRSKNLHSMIRRAYYVYDQKIRHGHWEVTCHHKIKGQCFKFACRFRYVFELLMFNYDDIFL